MGLSGWATAKVCSWCTSRLGGFAASATFKSPPRCGFSSARAAGVAHSPTSITTLSIIPVPRPIRSPPVWELRQRLVGAHLLLGQPHVLKATVQPVARHGLVIADTRRAHFEAGPPQAWDHPGLFEDALLHVLHELGTLLLVTLHFLFFKEFVDYWILKAAPVLWRVADEFGHDLIGVCSGSKAVGIDEQLKIPVQSALTPGSALLQLVLGLDANFLPGRHQIDSEVNVGQFHGAIRQHRFEAVGIARLGQQAFGFLKAGFGVFAKAGQLL